MEHEALVFVDANVFVALLNKDDALHEGALAVWSDLKGKNARLLTANVIAGEVLTVLSQRGGKMLALDLADTIYTDNQDIEIVYTDAEIEQRALQYFRKLRSKNVSFADTIILAVMEQRGVSYLASFDKFFGTQKGVKVIPGSSIK